MQFQDAIKVCFQKYVDFKGTAKRPEFWYFFLLLFIVNVASSQFFPILGSVFSLATLLPALAVGARRLHDTGKSGWWQLIGLTGIGVFVLLFFWSQEGK
jgi:uncharacterized membrane protein YhaH (DUF805 family)